MIEIAMHTADNGWWKQLILLFARPSTSFAIHCWQDEPQWIARGAAVWHDAAIARWIRRCCGGWCDHTAID